MDEDILFAIVTSEVSDFRTLAKIAGGHPRNFYRGSNFSGVDLRGEDLSNFDLRGSNFFNVKFDHTTIVDREFQSLLRPILCGTISAFRGESYGFIAVERGSEVFVHIRELQRAGMAKPIPGKKVWFELEQKLGGVAAVNLRFLPPPAS
jgi:cold shock CspA family protein